MATSSQDVAPGGPPYASRYAQLGGLPTIIPDVPIAAVFIALFIGGAAGHMTIFQLNRRRGYRFIPSVMIFGFCMARITSMVLRIAWANYPKNVRLALAANIFLAAGVLILYLVNLIFTQRIIRGTHPKLGWNRWFSRAFILLYALIPVALALVITASIQSVYTLDTHILRIDSYMRVSVQAFLLFISILPLPLLAINFLLPRPPAYHANKFGVGKWRTKFVILVPSAVLLTIGTAFKVGIGFQDVFHPRPFSDPGWYHSKALFWVVSVTVEVIVVYLYLLFRIDLRFWVPNGSSRVRRYSTGQTEDDSAKPTAVIEEYPLSNIQYEDLDGQTDSRNDDYRAKADPDNVSEHSRYSDGVAKEDIMTAVLSDLKDKF